jgi:hypothetical protein
MQIVRRNLRGFGVAATPRGRVTRLRLRTTIDTLLALVITLLAVALAIGYQVFRRRATGSGAA